MSKTIRNRKQGHYLFSNSWTNRNRKKAPKTSWEDLRVIHADGSGNFWLNNVSKDERKEGHKKNRKQAKQSLKCNQNKDFLEWDNFFTGKKHRYW